MFKVKSLSVSVENIKVITGVSFDFKPGCTFVMGQNGSGKSSLASALAGHPRYIVTHGVLELGKQDITGWSPDKRARAGLFLSMQHPQELPGITVSALLRESLRAQGNNLSEIEFMSRVDDALDRLQFDRSFLSRCVNEGFSGGEKKRCELLQLLVLQPRYIILDEIDSGLDVDALALITEALVWYQKKFPQTVLIVITHYSRMAQTLTPDCVVVMDGGALVKMGDSSLACAIQESGYDQFKNRA